MKRRTRLQLGHSVGKKRQETCDKLTRKLCARCKDPTKENKASFYTDGNPQYTSSIQKYYDTDTINYGQLVKIRENGRLVRKEKRVIFGEPGWIETVFIERHNLTIRNGVSRAVRKTLCISKVEDMMDKQMDLYEAYYNIIRLHSGLTIRREGKKNISRTPCMAEEITDHRWTWEEFLNFKLLPLVY